VPSWPAQKLVDVERRLGRGLKQITQVCRPISKLIWTATLWVNPLVALRSFFVCARKPAQNYTSLPHPGLLWGGGTLGHF
jgi:hypothetical protein